MSQWARNFRSALAFDPEPNMLWNGPGRADRRGSRTAGKGAAGDLQPKRSTVQLGFGRVDSLAVRWVKTIH